MKAKHGELYSCSCRNLLGQICQPVNLQVTAACHDSVVQATEQVQLKGAHEADQATTMQECTGMSCVHISVRNIKPCVPAACCCQQLRLLLTALALHMTVTVLDGKLDR